MKTLRRFELVDDKSRKFWEVEVVATEMTVRYGRIGAAGTTQTRSLPSAEACAREVEKLVREKTAKGYVETGAEPAMPKPVEASGERAKPVASKETAKAAAPPASSLAEVFRTFLDVAKMVDPRVEVPPPATEAQLDELGTRLGFALPPDLRALLEVSNGPTAPIFAQEGHLQSTDQIVDQWAFCREAVQASDAQLLIPISVDNGLFAYVIETPGDRRRGAIAQWDPDGESFGSHEKVVAKSLRDLVVKAEAKARRALPKGMSVVPGFAFGKAPSPEMLDEIIATLAKSKRSIKDNIDSLTGNRVPRLRVVEGLLASWPDFLSFEAHDEILASLAGEIDVGVVLAAFRFNRKIKKREEYLPRYLEGWTAHLDDTMTTLLARDAAAVHAAAPSFAPSIRDGYALVLRRLALTPLSDLPPALQVRVAKEACRPPRVVRVTEGEGTRTTEMPESGNEFEFALAPFFTDLDQHSRILLDWVLASEGLRIPRWVVGPCLRVATPEEAKVLFSKMGGWSGIRAPDVLENPSAAARPLAPLLAETARLMEKDPALPVTSRQAVAWAAYKMATRESAPLPALDDLLAGYDDVADSSSFVKYERAILERLGQARVAAIFTKHPQVAAALS